MFRNQTLCSTGELKAFINLQNRKTKSRHRRVHGVCLFCSDRWQQSAEVERGKGSTVRPPVLSRDHHWREHYVYRRRHWLVTDSPIPPTGLAHSSFRPRLGSLIPALLSMPLLTGALFTWVGISVTLRLKRLLALNCESPQQWRRNPGSGAGSEGLSANAVR